MQLPGVILDGVTDRRTQPIAMPPDSVPALPVVRSLGQLGRYELLSLLAKGGMGEVYLARSRGLAGFEKLVVIKRSLPSLAAEQEPLFAEARLVATLQHTNIVQVYDVESDGSTVFMAMEFLHGQDVRAIIRRSWGAGAGLPLDHALAIALAMCAGLHYAHDKRDADGTPLGIVHRDVSPSNVFVTYDGGVKLIDFGIAKATTLPSETQLGTIKGKPGYMSPEQCRGEPLDRRSDVFSLGIMLYEMTTGRRPFQGDSEYMLYREICEVTPPAPSALDPAYPRALEAIVMRALAKNRRDRPADVHEVQAQLAELASELRFDVSQFALGRYMAAIFEDELAAWREAQRTGQSLVEHVIRKATASMPIIDIAIAGTKSSATTVHELPKPKRNIAGLLALGGAALAIVAAVAVMLGRDERTPVDKPTPVEPAPQAVVQPPVAVPAPVPEPPPVSKDPAPEAAPVVTAPAKPKPKRRAAARAPKPAAGSAVLPGPDDPI